MLVAGSDAVLRVGKCDGAELLENAALARPGYPAIGGVQNVGMVAGNRMRDSPSLGSGNHVDAIQVPR